MLRNSKLTLECSFLDSEFLSYNNPNVNTKCPNDKFLIKKREYIPVVSAEGWLCTHNNWLCVTLVICALVVHAWYCLCSETCTLCCSCTRIIIVSAVICTNCAVVVRELLLYASLSEDTSQTQSLLNNKLQNFTQLFLTIASTLIMFVLGACPVTVHVVFFVDFS